MSIPGDASPLLLGGGGPQQYKIERSLRFNSSDSAYLSRTPASAGNRKTFTWSGWVKRATLSSGGRQGFFNAGVSLPGDSGYFEIGFVSDSLDVTTGSTGLRRTSALFRDTSAWLHILVAVNTTEATASNRVKVYINGTEQTQFSVNGNVAQNTDTAANNNVVHAIGREEYLPGNYFDGYLADVHLIDGQALDPTSFAETNITTGQWVPKAYTGTYGTNGFRLAFADNSNNTATTLGKDSSPNGNNWTPNNLSVTAGAGNDSLVDTPTSYGTDTGAGGEVRGNYATLNPLAGSVGTLSNGNLDCSTSATISHRRSTIAITSGKWYWECTPNSSSDLLVGIVNNNATFSGNNSYPGGDADGWSYYQNNGNKYNNGGSSYGASYTNGDVIGIAFDADAGTLTFYKNGVSQGQAFSGLTSGPYFAAVGNGGLVDRSYSINFGQRQWAYQAPAGFKALCDTNLPAPVVAKPNSVFDVKLYTGNGSSQTISGLGFSPDLVWIKDRNAGFYHNILDTIRGGNARLSSNVTDAENTGSAGGATPLISTFNSDGFTFPNGNFNTNATSTTYVAWTWDAGSSTVTNTQGSITSQVRANASAGFSIVTYTGNGVLGATVGHGLGVAPSFVITKSRNVGGGNYAWGVFHKSLGGTKALKLNATEAATTALQYWNNTDPSSTVFTIGSLDETNNGSATYVAYCFAPVAGYSSAFSYSGSGSSDGPAVWLGFRPRLILIKRSDSTADWQLYDTARGSYNVVTQTLAANVSSGESGFTSGYDLDILSSGFKVRAAASNAINTSGGTYIGFAWAESPFQYARAR